MSRLALAIALPVFLVNLPARADRRSFIRAYEYATQPQGNLEVELWNDVEAPRTAWADSVFTHRVELEYGLTDRWDLALYHSFEHGGPAAAPAPFAFKEWQVETRYRLAEKGEWPVDVMLYLELNRLADLREPFEVEEKLILAKDVGRMGFVANLVGEQSVLRGDKGRIWELDLGVRYELMPQIRLAAEFWTQREVPGAGEARTRYFLGPSISLASSKVWIQLGAGFGLGDTDQAMQIRSVLGFNL